MNFVMIWGGRVPMSLYLPKGYGRLLEHCRFDGATLLNGCRVAFQPDFMGLETEILILSLESVESESFRTEDLLPFYGIAWKFLGNILS